MDKDRNELTEKNVFSPKNKSSNDQIIGLLADCGGLLSRHSNPVIALVEIVRIIGESLDVDRMQYFVRDPIARVSHCITGWERHGIEPLQPGPFRDDDFSEVIDPLSRGEIYSTAINMKTGRNLEFNEQSGTKVDMLVPVIVSGELCGILNVDQVRHQIEFTDLQVNTMRTLATMVANALGRFGAEGNRLHEEKRHLAREATIESAVSVVRELLSIGNYDAALNRVLPLIGAMAACQRVALLIRDQLDGRPRHKLSHEWTATGHASLSSEGLSIFYDDLTPTGAINGLEAGSPFWWRTAGRSDEFSIRHQALGVAVSGALPLLVEGRYSGMMAFGWCFDPELVADGVEFRVLQLATNSVAAALQRQRADERRIEQEREKVAAVQFEQARHERHRADQLETANGVLRAINQRLADGSDPDIVLQAILDQAVLTFGAKAGSMQQFAGSKERLISFANSEFLTTDTQRQEAFSPTAQKSSGLNWRSVTNTDLANGKLWSDSGITEVLEAEIFDGDHVAGLLRLGFPNYTEEKRTIEWLIEQICQQAALAMRLAALSTELESRARTETILAERTRMAREIHDGVAQGFTGILMQLGALPEAADNPDNIKELTHRAVILARQGLADARLAIMTLQSDDASREDLVSALSQLVETSSIPSKINCSFHSFGQGFDTFLGPSRAHDLYRVVQEALNNALRHAHASQIDVTLTRSTSGIHLEVSDNGIGFVEDLSDGFGISNMRARVQDMGGALYIQSAPNSGTTVIVEMPL